MKSHRQLTYPRTANVRAEDIAQVKAKLHKLLRHLENVHKACQLLGEKLIDNGEPELGITLIANSLSHDQSKFHGMEWEHLVTGTFDKPEVRLAAHHHIKTNPHHPEYWGGIDYMPRVFVAEMVCDWYARSTEFGENVWEFINEKAMNRFGIQPDSEQYCWIKEFLDLLLDRPFDEAP